VAWKNHVLSNETKLVLVTDEKGLLTHSLLLSQFLSENERNVKKHISMH